MSFELTVEGMSAINQELSRLRIPLAKRRWVHITLSRKVRVFSRSRIRNSKNIDGSVWQPRKRKEFSSKAERNNKKMLRGLGQRMRSRGDHDQGVVDWSGHFVAGFHQFGGDEHWDAAKAKRIYGDAKYSAKATRNQALRLLALGYKIRQGKRWKRPTIKQIISDMSMGQAGYLIKILKGSPTVKSWTIPVPARPFLGVTQDEQKQLLILAMKTIVGIQR